MNRRDFTQDADRPHYYSTYWINIARQYGGKPGGFTASPVEMDEEEEDEDLLPLPHVETKAPPLPPELEILQGGRPTAPTRPSKAKPPEQRSTLSSLQDLAALGFGDDVQTQDLAIGADDEEEDIISRLESDFEDEVEPDEEEAASLEALEDEEWEEDDEEEDDVGSRRRTKPAPKLPPKPSRRPPPRRTRDF